MSSETKLYTMAEVAKHNTNKTTWICIHNSIYDVTEFLNEHIFFHAGKAHWADTGHPSKVQIIVRERNSHVHVHFGESAKGSRACCYVPPVINDIVTFSMDYISFAV
ncbi:hypothetical protein DMENIID0001_049080 [Sergentomyia squamirostris]